MADQTTPLRATRVNMAAVAARMAADEAEDRGSDLVYDAGELRSRDLAVSGNLSGMLHSNTGNASGGGLFSTASLGPYSAVTPSKTRGRLWDARQMDSAAEGSAAQHSNKSSSMGGKSPTTRHQQNEEGDGGKAGQARRKMLALRAQVVDALDVLSAQREDAVVKIKTLQSNTARNNAGALAAIAAFDAGFVHLDKVGRDVRAVMAEAGTELTMDFFDKFKLPVRVPNEETIRTYLNRTSAKFLTDEESAQWCVGMRRDVTGQLFPVDDKLLPELICAVNRFTKTDVVKAVNDLLARHDHVLASLDKEIAETEELIRVATAKEDLAEAERLTAKLLELSGKRTDTRAVQMKLLLGEEDDTSPASTGSSMPHRRGSSVVPSVSSAPSAAGFVRLLDQLLYGTAIPKLKTEKTTLIEAAKRDIGKLNTHHAKVVRANELDVARYNLATAESRQKMQEVHRKQNEIWEKVLELMNELEAAGKEKEALAEAHVRATDAEQLRRQDHREYLDSYRRHFVTLEDLVKNGETALSFLKAVQDSFEAAKAEVEASGIEGKLQDILTNHRKSYYEAFAHFGHGSNKHVARYDQRVSNCEFMLQELEFAYKEAPRVGDAEKNSYAKRVGELTRQKRSAAANAEDFLSAYTVREDQFANVAVRVHLAQRSRAEKLEKGLNTSSQVETNTAAAASPISPRDTLDGAHSEEAELLASLRGTRAKALLARLDRIAAATNQTAVSLEGIRQQQVEVEGKLAAEEEKHKARRHASTASPSEETENGGVGPNTTPACTNT